MANLSYIDAAKSIATGRLIYKRSWLDIIDQIVFSVLCLAFVFYPTLAYFHAEINNTNKKILAFVVFPVIILLGLYGLYRKLTETTLTSIPTSLTRHRNKELLLEFLKQKGYNVFRQSKEVVIVKIEESLSFNNLWTKTITFIIDDRGIYFNILKNYPKLNPPTLFSHLFLRARLKNFFSDKT